MDQIHQQTLLDEIMSLNADDLSIEELERRLELNMPAPIEEGDCPCTNFSCGTYKPAAPVSCCEGFRCNNFS